MNYVYVLTSTPQDLYYEQALMSVYSLRRIMPGADIIVLVDDKTAASLTAENGRAALAREASRIVTVEFPAGVTNVERSRLIKTSIPDYVDGDFLYIDCDTIICGDLSPIADVPFETGGVLDGHVLLEGHIHKKYFLRRDKKLGFHGTAAAGFNINGGIVLAKAGEESRALFRAWNEAWKFSAYQKHDLHDQSALNEANWRTGLKMRQLDGIWNCQPSHGGLAYLKDAKIIHYYSSEFSGKHYIPYYKLADKALQGRVKAAGDIPDDVRGMIAAPKFQFNAVHLVSDARIVPLMQSPLVFTLADIQAHCPPLFGAMEAACGGMRSLARKIKGTR